MMEGIIAEGPVAFYGFTMKAPFMLAAAALSLAAFGCRGRGRAPEEKRVAAPASPHVMVPRLTGSLRLDGHLEEPDWRRCGRGGPFLERGTRRPARPYSEVRFLWDARRLYVGLYAADQDLRAIAPAKSPPAAGDDAFWLRVGQEGGGVLVLAFTPRGAATEWRERAGGRRDPSWRSGVQAAVDRDGTINNPADEDEEWVIEAAIPLASLGLAPRPGATLRLAIERCDTPKGSPRRCGTWGRDERGAMTGLIELAEQAR